MTVFTYTYIQTFLSSAFHLHKIEYTVQVYRDVFTEVKLSPFENKKNLYDLVRLAFIEGFSRKKYLVGSERH